MAKFDTILQGGNVSITKQSQDEYKFEYTKYDPDTGNLKVEKHVRYIRRSDLEAERSMLVSQKDDDVARYDVEIDEIDAKLAAIGEV